MLVPFVVRRSAQFFRRSREAKSEFFDVGSEDSELFMEIGRTALKARNCFAAASELFNVCFERDSRSRLAWFMGGH